MIHYENLFEKCIADQNRDREGAETEGIDCGSGNRFLTCAVLNKLFKHAQRVRGQRRLVPSQVRAM